MIWYQTGTISVANGSTIVAGAGTSFIDNVAPGAGFISTDGRTYPVAAVNSDNQLTLETPYQGANTAGAAYVILPTQAYDLVLARRVLELTNSFSDMRDGVGQGLFPDGSLAAPGVRFANDQDTGLARDGSNRGALVAGGVPSFAWSPEFLQAFRHFVPIASDGAAVTVHRTDAASANLRMTTGFPGGTTVDMNSGINGISNSGFTLSMNGSVRLAINEAGNVGMGTNNPGHKLEIVGQASNMLRLLNSAGNGTKITFADNAWAAEIEHIGGRLLFKTAGDVERVRIDDSGNLLVGTTSGTKHIIQKVTSNGEAILEIARAGVLQVAAFFAVDGTGQDGANAANAALKVGSSSTGRSISTAGTINASGADYAEYMLKAAGCGLIAKGDVCGVDADGHLTKSWADAISFVVKSTDPSLVGGDAWANELREKPTEPGAAPIAPIAPIAPEMLDEEPALLVRIEDESDDAFAARVIAHAAATAAYQERVAQWATFDAAQSSYPGLAAQYQSALADHQAAVADYDADLADWESELEALRARVDRIAFSGQVPCNVTGDFAVGDYIVAAANGGGIKAIAVAEADMTLPLYMKRIGKVWAVTDDGRAWIDVQHG